MTKRTRQRPDAQPQDLQPEPTAAAVFSDRLLRVSVVVETAAGLWLVPKTAGGWQRRARLIMTPEARTERLTVAGDISPGWLGIPEGDGGKNGCETAPPTNERPTG
jgi:hypothetical protein